MKKPVLLISILFSILLSMTAQNSMNKYDNDWKQVIQFEKDDLPQSASGAVDVILQKAIKDKNIQQVIKAYLHKDKYKIVIDKNDNLSIFSDLQGLILQTRNPGEIALLHSILAELYIDYYSTDRWKINNRTALFNTIPDDIREWPANIFINKSVEHLNASLQDVKALKGLTSEQYADIILLGEDSRKYYPTLYDFLMTRAINVAKRLPMQNGNNVNLENTGLTIGQLATSADQFIKLDIKENQDCVALSFYQQYFKDLLARNMISTVIMTELDKVDYMGSLSYSFLYNQTADFLKELQNKYQYDDTTVEIIIALGDAINMNRYGSKIDNTDRLTRIYNLYKDGVNKYPDNKRTNILRGRLNELEYPDLKVKMKDIYLPHDSVNIEIEYKNLQALNAFPILQLIKIENGDSIVVKDLKIDYRTKEKYISEKKTINVGPLEIGRYDIKHDINTIENLVYSDLYGRYLSPYYPESNGFAVSNLMAYSRNNAYQECEIFVVERKKGKPIEGVTVNLYKANRDGNESKDELITTLKTDNIGRVNFKDIQEINAKGYNRVYYTLSLGNDSAFPKQYISPGYYTADNFLTKNGGVSSVLYQEDEDDFYGEMSVFTDRNIYRPGQTVYFKAIASGENYKPGANKKVNVTLFDENGETVAEKELQTNEFGSVAGEFILPQSGLLGQYHIEADCDSETADVYFQVEEYKRPTFDVTFDKIEETYRFGEEITLKGYARSFSGINLQDADVQYTINGYPFRLWGWDSQGGSTFEEGNVKTQADGSFEIRFIPQAKDIAPGILRKNIYNYNINASVTDLNGETQVGSFSMSVGDVSMTIEINVPAQIEKSDSLEIGITARNLNGQYIKTSGKYVIYALDKNDSIKSNVLNGSFEETGLQKTLRSRINNLPSGKYKIKVTALDSKNIEVDNSADFVLFSYKDKRPPIETNEWLVEKNKIFGVGENAEILFGVSDKDMYILYQIYNNKEVFKREIIRLNNANKLFSIPYRDEYGDGVNISLTYVKDDKFYSKQVILTKKTEIKDDMLVLKLESFRDKMRPGSEESWTLSVKDSKGNPLSAEILASMYDASLDKLFNDYYNQWKLNVPKKYIEYVRPASYLAARFSNGYFEDYPLYLPSEQLKLTGLYFDEINWYGFDFRYPKMLIVEDSLNIADVKGSDDKFGIDIAELRESKAVIRGASSVLAGKVPGVVANMDSSGGTALDEVVVVGYGTQRKANVTGSISYVAAEEIDGTIQEFPQIRKNFNETAFFYPQLRTNEKGETVISFTVPESNTTWRFRALAHDKDLKSGLLQQYVITRKELMVTPNMPRFVRQGDKTNISTKISNLSDGAISGKVYIEFFDPTTEKVIDLGISNKNQSFSLEKDASGSVNWTFDIPENIELLGCRIVAGNNTFSDGEQHVLAVLSNRMLVTESMPVDVSEQGESRFKFDKLANNNSSTLSNYKLTFEFTGDPVWYAIMAMPTLSTPVGENALNWFASYYANRLGQSIMQRFPRVQTMIELWKKQGGDKETLLSNLQKDEELKNVLLSETPWVLEAKNETEQMQRISLLFDLNNTNQKLDLATKKLAELQDPMGGWSWFKGMYPSRTMTQYILFAFADLQTYGQVEFGQEIKEMQIKAIWFIDGELKKDYETLKKNNKNWQNIKSITTTQLEYLFVRNSYRDIPIDQQTREAERFYTSIAGKNWRNLNLYERSILSIVLQGLGERQLSNQIVKSIRERAVVNSKQGMYWPNNTNHAFLTMSAVCNHVFLMKALMDNNTATPKDIDLMKQWLIKQKQTQMWESTNATIDAINILLGTGSDWLADDTDTQIKVGGQTISTANEEAGTGYIKTTWEKSEITNQMGDVSITRPNDKPAYGALYWQYYEEIDKITSQKTDEISVNKELYKEVIDATGEKLVPITGDTPLTVGEKVIVRLTVRLTNDMEFVQLKDMRAPCFEPVNTVSGTSWQGEALYYQETRDASTNFYFDQLRKGTYVFEYPLYVNRTGEYSNGITTIQCLYAPGFISHTQGIKVTVK